MLTQREIDLLMLLARAELAELYDEFMMKFLEEEEYGTDETVYEEIPLQPEEGIPAEEEALEGL